MNKSIYFLIAICLVLLLPNCARVSWKVDERPMVVSSKMRLNYFIGGIAGHPRLHLEELCPNGQVATVKRKRTFGNLAAAFFTFQIWTPATLEVFCAVPNTENTKNNSAH